MAPQIWDPNQILNINAYGTNDMFCVGVAVSRGNSCCRWHITNTQHSKVCSILEEMEATPPREIHRSKLLSRLARLSLCEEYHQPQKYDVLERWNDLIDDVAIQQEEKEKLKTRNRQLRTELDKEREQRALLQRLLTQERADGQMIRRLAAAPGASTIVASAQKLSESEARESVLQLQVIAFEHSLADLGGKAERLATRVAELSRQLIEERHTSAQQQKDHDVATKQVDELQSQLSAQRQTSEELRGDLEKVKTNRNNLLTQNRSLESALITQAQSLNQVRSNLDEAETTQVALLKEKETLQSLLVEECESSGQLEKRRESLEAELAIAQKTLERTQLDLMQSRKVNEQQAAADVVYKAATAAGTARMLEQIRQLEVQTRTSFLSTFIGRIKWLAGHIALWARPGGWPAWSACWKEMWGEHASLPFLLTVGVFAA